MEGREEVSSDYRSLKSGAVVGCTALASPTRLLSKSYTEK